MPKIAFLGAGSIGFGRRLIGDILSFPDLADSSVHLMDPNEERLEFIRAAAGKMVEAHGLPTRIEASTEREPALDGADYVIVSIRVGRDMREEQLDVQIPIDVCGLRQTVSDTVGVGGVMKGLRTIPAMLEIARDMERLCPHAVMLNYTNPMAMIMWAIAEATSISAVGLCHSVQHTHDQLASYLGLERPSMKTQVAGINHMAWFIELRQGRKNLYPRLRECLDDPEIFARDPVRFEIFRHFGYFVTESSTHMAEYVPYFMKDHAEIERLSIKQRSGETFAGQQGGRKQMLEKAWKELDESAPAIKRSNEYAAAIMHAMETNTACCIYGNVPNNGLISNLPEDSCVEVPCLINRAGLQPCHIGDLPPQCAALCTTNINMQRLVVRAILEENREYAIHAAILDPNTFSQLSLPQIRETMEKLLEAQSDLMPPLH